MRRSDVSKSYRFCNAAAIYIPVPDGVVLVSMWTQVLILAFLRTRKIPFVQSRPSAPVICITLAGIIAFTAITFTKGAGIFRSDAFAILVFHIFVDCGIAVYASDNGG